MHVVITVMVMCVTFFRVSMVVIVFILIIVSAFYEQQFHRIQFRNGDQPGIRNLARGLFHKRFHFRPDPDD